MTDDEPTVEPDLPTVETDRPTIEADRPTSHEDRVGATTTAVPRQSAPGWIPLPLAIGALVAVAAIGVIAVSLLPDDDAVLPEPSCGPGMVFDPVDASGVPQAGELVERWSVSGLDVAATPAVVLGDVAVVASRGDGESGGTVAFFDMADGSVLGSYEMPGSVWAAPAVDERFSGGVVWVSDDTGMLVALGAAGDPMMTCELPSAGNAPSPVSNSAGELLVVGTDGGVVRAIDPSTGEQQWVRRIGVGGASARSIATFSNTLAVGTSAGGLVILDGIDGEVLGEAAIGDEILAPPVATPDGEFVAATLDGTVARVDLTGATVWTVRLEGGVLGPMAVFEDELWVGSSDGEVTRLDLVSGEVVASFALDASIDGGVVAIDGAVVSADDSAQVVVHSSSGEEISRLRVAGPVNGGISAWDRGLLVADAGGTLTRLDTRAGSTPDPGPDE